MIVLLAITNLKDGSYSAIENLLNYITIFELTNHECRYFRQAAEIAMQNAKGYGQNNFKLKLAPNAIVEALKTATGKA